MISAVLICHLVYEPGTLFSIPVLAAHLYYRALLTAPTLIHSWVLDCKERQLSSAVIGYTSTHFSPLIIQAELAHAKSAEATSELVDENFTIKVTLSSNEVAAAYAVDDHQLEIRLKIPADGRCTRLRSRTSSAWVWTSIDGERGSSRCSRAFGRM